MNAIKYYSHLLLHSKIKVFLPLLICITCSFVHNDISNISMCEEIEKNNDLNAKLFGMSLFIGSIFFVFFLQSLHPTIDPSNMGDIVNSMIDASTQVTMGDIVNSTIDASTQVTPEMLGEIPEVTIKTDVPLKSNSSNGFFIKSAKEYEKMLGILVKYREKSWIRLDAYEELLEAELADLDAQRLHLERSLVYNYKYQDYLKTFIPRENRENVIWELSEWMKVNHPDAYNDLLGPVFGYVGTDSKK